MLFYYTTLKREFQYKKSALCPPLDKSDRFRYNRIATTLQLQGGDEMGTQLDKAKERLLAEPTNYTFAEAKSLLQHLGFSEHTKGKTSGSRVMFLREHDKIILHKPHPEKEMKHYAVHQLKEYLISIGELE